MILLQYEANSNKIYILDGLLYQLYKQLFVITQVLFFLVITYAIHIPFNKHYVITCDTYIALANVKYKLTQSLLLTQPSYTVYYSGLDPDVHIVLYDAARTTHIVVILNTTCDTVYLVRYIVRRTSMCTIIPHVIYRRIHKMNQTLYLL
jgi:hypothetical protein